MIFQVNGSAGVPSILNDLASMLHQVSNPLIDPAVLPVPHRVSDRSALIMKILKELTVPIFAGSISTSKTNKMA